MPRRWIGRSGRWAVAALFAACSSRPPATPAPAGALAAAESLYLDLRDLRDRIGVVGAAGRTAARDGTPVAALARRHNELRRALVTRLGAVVTGDGTWYEWVSRRLFRFGLERPTNQVIEEFLGGPVTAAALLTDMRG